MYHSGWAYWSDIWNYFETLSVLSMLYSFVLSVLYMIDYQKSYDSAGQGALDLSRYGALPPQQFPHSAPTRHCHCGDIPVFGRALMACQTFDAYLNAYGVTMMVLFLQLLKFLNAIPGLGIPMTALTVSTSCVTTV